jgi:RES domain-containing protein
MRNMEAHPRFDEICDAISRIRNDNALKPFGGIVYRYASSKYSTAEKMMSGEGSHRAGGRWNYPGVFHAVYCASSPELANNEFFAGCASAGLPKEKMMPVIGKPVRVKLDLVLDLRDRMVLRRLGIRVKDMREDPWRYATDQSRESLCQAIGRAACQNRVEALLAPAASAPRGLGFNIVLIRENLRPGKDRVRVLPRSRT